MNYSDSNSPTNYVSLVLNHEIRVEKVTDSTKAFLQELGAQRDEIAGEEVWILRFTDEEQEANLLSKLNQSGFIFVEEPVGWPPAEIFDALREKGLVSGSFTEVTWYGPGKWNTRVR